MDGHVNKHIDSLRSLRDFLVEDRRNLVTTLTADLHTAGDAAGDFLNLQQFIDIVERAISHELSLERPQGMPGGPGGKGPMPPPR